MENKQKYCRYLRGKNAYGTLEGGENPFLFIDTGTTSYWCLCTMASYGPDGGVSHVTACGKVGRKCFREARKEEDQV